MLTTRLDDIRAAVEAFISNKTFDDGHAGTLKKSWHLQQIIAEAVDELGIEVFDAVRDIVKQGSGVAVDMPNSFREMYLREGPSLVSFDMKAGTQNYLVRTPQDFANVMLAQVQERYLGGWYDLDGCKRDPLSPEFDDSRADGFIRGVVQDLVAAQAAASNVPALIRKRFNDDDKLMALLVILRSDAPASADDDAVARHLVLAMQENFDKSFWDKITGILKASPRSAQLPTISLLLETNAKRSELHVERIPKILRYAETNPLRAGRQAWEFLTSRSRHEYEAVSINGLLSPPPFALDPELEVADVAPLPAPSLRPD